VHPFIMLVVEVVDHEAVQLVLEAQEAEVLAG
jgi:hypothetical protein